MADDCIPKIQATGDVSKAEAQTLLHNMDSAAKARAAEGESFEQALKDIAGELEISEAAVKALAKRQVLLNTSAKRRIKDYVKQFATPGEGLRAFMEGSPKKVKGARYSVDYQAKSLHQKYFGRLIAEMEEQDVLRDFMTGDLDREVFIEMGELGREDGQPGKSGSKVAQKIAAIAEGVTNEMVGRQNRAGAWIQKMAGYVIRQTHDRSVIRQVGGGSKEKSFKVWSDYILPRLDHKRTFKGNDPLKFLRNVHEGLYSSVHGPVGDETEIVNGFSINLGRKASKERVLHFKDANAAFEYNQEFGTKNLRDSLFGDIFFRSRNIALMENFGPNAEAVLDKAIRELGEEARVADNAAELTDSLKDWRIKAAFNTITGKNDLPSSYGLAKVANTIRVMTTLSKMGATVISAVTDKGFFQSEMAFQGISGLDTMGKQITLFAKKSKQEKQMLRYMGVALDGLIGNTVSRYTMHTSVAGVGHRMQQKLFDINFMNWWTDNHKGAAAELMAAHLGEHASMRLEDLPGELSHILSLYNISRSEWDALRSTAWTPEGQEHRVITADKVNEIPDATIDALVEEQGLTVTKANRDRVRDRLESKLRTYIADRVDIAVPSPGAAEKKYLTMNTQAGTPLGEAVRMLTLFKSFPVAVLNKIIARDVYGNGANSIKDWVMNDHKGKFRVMQTVAMATALGYLSGVIRDALKGREPKPLTVDGKINFPTLQDAMLRGGGAGLLGDLLFAEYDNSKRNFLSQQAGPVFGQVNPLMNVITKAKTGETEGLFEDAGKLTLDNTPLINLFYIRPVLDYLFLWNLQEMMDPGSLERMERAVSERNHQEYFLKPSEAVNR
jgi:hypothetical protein